VSPAEAAHHRAEMLLQRLEDLGLAARSLSEPLLRHQPAPVALLADRLRLRQELCLSAILDCLVQLESAAERQELLDRLSSAAPAVICKGVSMLAAIILHSHWSCHQFVHDHRCPRHLSRSRVCR
jgi:hypothetical protein